MSEDKHKSEGLAEGDVGLGVGRRWSGDKISC